MQTSSKKSFITSNIGTIFLSLSISFFLSSWTDFSLFYRWLRRVAIPRIRWPLKNLFHIILHFRQRTVASRDSLFPSTNAVKLRDYNFKVRSHIYFSKKNFGPFPASFFFIFVFSTELFNTVYRNKICRWLDSNRGSLVSEATALPIEPQSLSKNYFSYFIHPLLDYPKHGCQ